MALKQDTKQKFTGKRDFVKINRGPLSVVKDSLKEGVTANGKPYIAAKVTSPFVGKPFTISAFAPEQIAYIRQAAQTGEPMHNLLSAVGVKQTFKRGEPDEHVGTGVLYRLDEQAAKKIFGVTLGAGTKTVPGHADPVPRTDAFISGVIFPNALRKLRSKKDDKIYYWGYIKADGNTVNFILDEDKFKADQGMQDVFAAIQNGQACRVNMVADMHFTFDPDRYGMRGEASNVLSMKLLNAFSLKSEAEDGATVEEVADIASQDMAEVPTM